MKTQSRAMTTTSVRAAVATLGLTLLAVWAGVFSAAGQEPQPRGLKPIMKEKLKHTQFLIEGLAQEDYPMIADHARQLRLLGEDALRRVSPSLPYVKYCAEFVSITDELERRAKEEDLNGATLSYIRLTMNCVECHKFSRDNRILDQRKPAK